MKLLEKNNKAIMLVSGYFIPPIYVEAISGIFPNDKYYTVGGVNTRDKLFYIKEYDNWYPALEFQVVFINPN